MPNATRARIREFDTDVWRTATRAAPVVVQVVIAAVFGVGWLLGRLPVDSDNWFRILVATATVVTTVAAQLTAAALLRTESPRRRGLGLAIGGSGLAVLLGGLTYALVFLPLMDTSA